MSNRATRANWQNKFIRLISDTSLPQSAISRYGIAVIAVIIATLLKLGQNALVSASQGSSTPFLTFFGAVMVAAWYGGLGPGLFATLLAAFISGYFFMMPFRDISISGPTDLTNLLLFCLECAIISLFGELLRRAFLETRLEIAERQRIGEQLVQERERFEVTLSSIGDAVIATDTEGRVTFMNRVSENLTGWPLVQASGQKLDEVFHIVNEYTREIVENPVSRVLRENIVVGLANHTVLLSQDGREIPIEDSGAPIRDSQGQTAGVVLVFRDVIERRQLEDRQRFLFEASRLLASSLDYDTTMQNVVQLAVPFVADWCILYILEQDGQTVQYLKVAQKDPAKEELGRKLTEYYAARTGGSQTLSQIFKTDQAVLSSDISEAQLEALAPDPEILDTIRGFGFKSLINVPLVARSYLQGLIAFVTAESGRRFSQADLVFAEEFSRRAAASIDNARLYLDARTAIKNRDEFLSVAAHELKTPLTGLQGYSQLLLRQLGKTGTLDPVRMQQALEAINRQSDKLARLISQLLDITQIDAGKLKLERRPTDLKILIEQVVETARTNAPKHTITIDVPPKMEVLLDPVRFEQVVVNLVDNAIKYSPQGGLIKLEVNELPDNKFCMSVNDQGIGIPLERREQIFERFYQAHEQSYLSGMGLGLYITRQIVELHGGQIEVEFPEAGGSTFIVKMPQGIPSSPA